MIERGATTRSPLFATLIGLSRIYHCVAAYLKFFKQVSSPGVVVCCRILCCAQPEPGVESEVLPTTPADLSTFALLPNYQASHTQVTSPYSQSPRLFLKQVKISLTMAFARLVESTSHFIPGKVKAFSQVMPLRCR